MTYQILFIYSHKTFWLCTMSLLYLVLFIRIADCTQDFMRSSRLFDLSTSTTLSVTELTEDHRRSSKFFESEMTEDTHKRILVTPTNYEDVPWTINQGESIHSIATPKFMVAFDDKAETQYYTQLMADQDTNGTSVTKDDCIITISGAPTCELCFKVINASEYAILCNASFKAVYHINCYSLWKHQVLHHQIQRVRRKHREISDDVKHASPSSSNIPFGELNISKTQHQNNTNGRKSQPEQRTHLCWRRSRECKIISFSVFTLIIFPVLLIVLLSFFEF